MSLWDEVDGESDWLAEAVEGGAHRDDEAELLASAADDVEGGFVEFGDLDPEVADALVDEGWF